MGKVKWILTCNGECPRVFTCPDIDAFARLKCPQDCPQSYFEREYLNTELPSEEGEG